MKKVFLVSLHDTTARESTIIGFISSNNRELIANYIKNHYGHTLQDLLPNKFGFSNDYRQKYATDASNVNVYVDVCYNLDRNEDE